MITATFLYIWLTTGDANDVFTPEALALLGISGTTGLAAAAISNSAQAAAAGQKPAPNTPASSARVGSGQSTNRFLPTVRISVRKFLGDILSGDEGDIQLHRVQIVIWTLILGMVFIWQVYSTFRMPKFDSTLLIMMGISGGLYVGFKSVEK
jgi:hypothetical protein